MKPKRRKRYERPHRTITFQANDETFAALDKLENTTGKTRSVIIRNAIQDAARYR